MCDQTGGNNSSVCVPYKHADGRQVCIYGVIYQACFLSDWQGLTQKQAEEIKIGDMCLSMKPNYIYPDSDGMGIHCAILHFTLGKNERLQFYSENVKNGF